MRFEPKTEEEIQVALIAPDGEYDFTVIEAVEKTSKKGNAMIEVRINVFTEVGELHLYDYLLELMAFKLRHFCSSIGVLADYNLGTLEVENIVGRSGRVKITSEKQEGYGLRNVVKDYVKKEHGEPPTERTNGRDPSAASVAPTGGPQDDIPF